MRQVLGSAVWMLIPVEPRPTWSSPAAASGGKLALKGKEQPQEAKSQGKKSPGELTLHPGVLMEMQPKHPPPLSRSAGVWHAQGCGVLLTEPSSSLLFLSHTHSLLTVPHTQLEHGV